MLFEEFYKEFCQYKASAPPQNQKKRKHRMSEVRSTPPRSKRKESTSQPPSNAESAVDIVEAMRANEDGSSREPGPQGRATVIMFHGNATNHGSLIDLAVQFLIMGCNVLTVSYRGYGNSTGKPSEGGE